MLITPELRNFIKGKRILVVDDEEGIRKVIVSLFEICGAIITEACNGNEAMVISSQHPIDLIISDIRMPNGDGIQLLDVVRSRNPGHPPFMFISGASEFTESMVIARGAQAMIAKPFSTKEVLSIARSVIESAACFSGA